jgi:YjzC-like protein
MGQNHQFKPGQKAPNNGTYIEIGDTGSNIINPKKIHLKKGQPFPESSNDDRIWTYTNEKGH